MTRDGWKINENMVSCRAGGVASGAKCRNININCLSQKGLLPRAFSITPNVVTMWEKSAILKFRVYKVTHPEKGSNVQETYFDVVELNDGHISYRKEFDSLEEAATFLNMSKGIDLTSEYTILPFYKFRI